MPYTRAELAERLRKRLSDLHLESVEPESPGLVGRVLSGLQPLFTAMDWGDKAARGLVGLALGEPHAWRGEAPTGNELVEYVTGLPQGPERTWAGFGTEMAVSPFNFIGLGELTAAGKAGQVATKALQRAAALKAATVGTPRAARAAAEIAELLARAERAAATAHFGRTLAEQAARGQRTLLSAGIPFTSWRTPLVPRAVSEAGLGALSKIGAGLRGLPGMETVARGFRVGGRVAPGLKVVREGVQPAEGALYNELVGVAEDVTRAGRFKGDYEADAVRRWLGGFDEAQARAEVERVSRGLQPLIRDAVTAHPVVARLRRRLEAAPVNSPEWVRLGESLAKKEARVLERLDWTAGLKEAEPRHALAALGLQARGTGQKLATEAEKVAARYAEKIARWRMVASATSDPKLRRTAAGTIARLRNNQADRLAALAAEQRFKRAAWDLLPSDMKGELSRIAGLTDDVLKIDQQTGVRVSELMDPHIGYFHRSFTTEGLEFSKQLDELFKANRLDSPFLRYYRKLSTAADFTQRRTRAFEGMTVTQINDMARRYAARLRDAGFNVAFGRNPTDQFFTEDVGESILRRLTESGRARGAAHLHRGVIELFSVPASAARLGDIPVEKYLEKAGVARLGELPDVLPETAAGIRKALEETQYEGRVIPREFANEALRTFETFTKPEELRKLGQYVEGANAMMRYWVTTAGVKLPGTQTTVPLFPAFHVRNVNSNVFMAFLAGQRNPVYYLRAWKLQRLARRAVENPGAAGPEARAALRTVQRMHELGALGGTVAAELPEQLAATRGLGALRANPADRALTAKLRSAARWVAQPGETETGRAALKFASEVENNAKIALWLDGKAKGLTDIEAARRVKKYLFDYSELGPVDKALRKYAFFYTWQRKAIPLMFEQMLTQPAKMHAYAVATGQTGETLQKEVLAAHEAARDPALLGTDGDGNFLFLSADLPPTAVGLLNAEGKPGWTGVMRVGQKLASQLAPTLRAPLESVSGVRLASGKGVRLAEESLALAPWSRLQATIRRVGRVAGGEQPVGDLAGLLGVSPVRADRTTARLRNVLESITARQEELRRRGRAHAVTIYSRPGGEADEEVDRLNSLRRRIEEALQRRKAH